MTSPRLPNCNLELLKETTRAAATVPLEILQSLAAANTLMTMTDDAVITHVLSDESVVSSDASSCESGLDDEESSGSSVIVDNDDSPCQRSEDGCDSNSSSSPSAVISLYSPADEGNIGALHNLFRRSIYEGYVVPRGQKYQNTVAFRCRFCSHLPPKKRAKQSEVYPRSIETLYRAHIRFHRDHYPMCGYIPTEVREEVGRIKGRGTSLARGSKGYWVTSALERGLRNGEEGIVLCGRASR